MESNIKKYYDKKDKIGLIDNMGHIFSLNPFYLVNSFICTNYGKKYLTDNYYNNIFNLKITNDKNNNYLFYYNETNNSIYSSNSKTDIFALLSLASTDRFNEKSGVIKNNIGYGLNYGITDFYNRKITKDKSYFPFECFIAHVLDKIDKNTLASSYFDPTHNNLSKIIPNDKYDEFLKLIDEYHDNYINLIKLNRNKFSEELYYHNLIYGNTLRKRNLKLNELEQEINLLESKNYTIVYDVLDNLINFISNNNNLTPEEKTNTLIFMSNRFNKIFSNDEFYYLNDLNISLKDSVKVKKIVKD